MAEVLFLRNKTRVDSHASRAILYRCVQYAAGAQMAVSYLTVFLATLLSLSPKVVSPGHISLGVRYRVTNTIFLWLSAHSLLCAPHRPVKISSVIPRRFSHSLLRYQRLLAAFLLVCSNFPRWRHLGGLWCLWSCLHAWCLPAHTWSVKDAAYEEAPMVGYVL